MLKVPIYRLQAALWLPLALISSLCWLLWNFQVAVSVWLGGAVVAFAQALQLFHLVRSLRSASSPTELVSDAESYEAHARYAVDRSRLFLKAYRRAGAIKMVTVVVLLAALIILKQQGPAALVSHLHLDVILVSLVSFQVMAVILVARTLVKV